MEEFGGCGGMEVPDCLLWLFLICVGISISREVSIKPYWLLFLEIGSFILSAK